MLRGAADSGAAAVVCSAVRAGEARVDWAIMAEDLMEEAAPATAGAGERVLVRVEEAMAVVEGLESVTEAAQQEAASKAVH